MNIKNIKEFMVFDGSVLDIEASLQVCKRAMIAYKESMMLSDDKLKEACDKVFDQYKDGRGKVQKAFDFIKRELPLNPDNATAIEKCLKDYLSRNTGEFGESLYGSERGLHGGTWRWSDKTAESKEAVKSLEEIAKRNGEVKA